MAQNPLGTDWTCDFCLKVLHTKGSNLPSTWTKVKFYDASFYNDAPPPSHYSVAHACSECWEPYLPESPEKKKTIMQRAKALLFAKYGETGE